MHTLEDGDKTVEIDFLTELASRMPSDAVLGIDWVQEITSALAFGAQVRQPYTVSDLVLTPYR